MDLAAYSDDEPRDYGDTAWCECGNRRMHAYGVCKRCAFLDGHKARAMVIAALRTLREATLAELCIAVHGNREHNALTAMVHLLARMVRKGRVRRYLDEGAGEDLNTGVRSYRGHEIRIRFGARPRYMYRLTEPGRSIT